MRLPSRSTSSLPSSAGRATAAVAVQQPAAVPRSRLSRGWIPWLLLAPALVPLVGLVLLPYAGALLYSLTGATLADITSPPLVGFKNFGAVAGSTEPPFSLVVEATAVFTLGTVVGSLGLGTLLALSLSTMKASRRGPLLAVFLIPWVIAGVVIGYTWKLVYDPQVGLANAILTTFRIAPVPWLVERWLAIGALIVANIWAAYGVVLLIVSSALTNVPRSLILAARIDGAGLAMITRRIILPSIGPAMLLATLVAFISGLSVFDLIFVLTGGGPIYQTETLALMMYRLTFRRGDVGEGAAVTVLLFVFSLLLAIAYVITWQREAKKWN
jgi:multiple sugar transport system permease protein